MATKKALAPRRATHCGRCGKPFTARACGPTHAAIAAERKAPTTLFTEPSSYPRCPRDHDRAQAVRKYRFAMFLVCSLAAFAADVYHDDHGAALVLIVLGFREMIDGIREWRPKP